MYTAELGEDGVSWGVTQDGTIVYESDMTETQARIVAMFHQNGWANEFEEIIDMLERYGIDFDSL